jgi:vacuolar-type H+-ATPase subunit F/Vma7
MSRLIVITNPDLAPGFCLAGVDVYPVEFNEEAQQVVCELLETGEAGLLAIDRGFVENLTPEILKSLEISETLHYLAIPGIDTADSSSYRRRRISELARRVIGFYSVFKTREEEPATDEHSTII